MAFSCILVANRGEIAVRVIRSARSLGYRTVAVYSDADARAPHVELADRAVRLGPPAASASYLDIERVIDAARESGADAVHPGYGFLSENADFARACAAAGLVFIGPPPEAIEMMGNKRAAKQAMAAAGVPCVPGHQAAAGDLEALAAGAEAVGFPLMVKAAAGGGGRGMRRVESPADLAEALRGAAAEAESAFGSGELILERAIDRARHVEVQVFADTHGNVIHLGERDCSVQRRHQKVIEESPSPAVDAELRRDIGAAAVAAARACGYVGAGTVELLLDPERRYYFLEMNTRLQVEHPVTELVTGIDLVAWQLAVAAGEPLPLAQDEIELSGHAIEARLYAEDPARGYMPQTGRVLSWRPPAGQGVRVDHGIAAGLEVGAHYDAMLAKVIAGGASREEARRRLVRALEDTAVLGLVTNKALLVEVLEHPSFAAGEATTDFLGGAALEALEDAAPSLADLARAAVVVFLEGARGLVEDESFIGWRSGGPVWSTVVLAAGELETTLQVSFAGAGQEGRRYAVSREPAGDGGGAPETTIETEVVEVVGFDDEALVEIAGGARRRLRWARDDGRVWLDDGRRVLCFDDVTHRPARSADAAASGRLVAPLDGALSQLLAAPGDAVEAGQVVMIIEAMKMEHRIEADLAGVLAAVHAQVGDQVKTRQLLAVIEPAGEGGEA